MRKLNIYAVEPFYSVFLMFHIYYAIFSEIFAHFLVQNFKTKVLTAQKKIIFEGPDLGADSV